MLNPSTADAEVDDPTIRRCMGFARSWRLGSVWVVNLFAFRATSPDDMKRVVNPVGPYNDDAISDLAEYVAPYGMHARVICAWGAHGGFQNRDTRVHQLLLKAKVHPECLGTTLQGAPRHPLYVKGDKPLEPYHT
jgi:hypothetical protein